MDDLFFKNYHYYLLKRTFKAYLYRRFVLYPQIKKRCYGKILDLGCGIGDFVKTTENSTGVDINKYNIEYCKENNINALWYKDSIPFKDNTFDTVLIDNVLEHIYDFEKLVHEALRVLNDKGILIIGLPPIKNFFHDEDHKVFFSRIFMRDSFFIKDIYLKEIFHVPSNSILFKYFLHSSVWFVYSVRRI